MRLLTVAVLGLSLLSGAALAQTSTPPPVPVADTTTTTTPPADDQQMVCVGQDPAASTRVHARRVCRTLEEWNKRGGVPK